MLHGIRHFLRKYLEDHLFGSGSNFCMKFLMDDLIVSHFRLKCNWSAMLKYLKVLCESSLHGYCGLSHSAITSDVGGV